MTVSAERRPGTERAAGERAAGERAAGERAAGERAALEALRDSALELLAADADPARDDAAMAPLRRAVRDRYRRYVRAYGPLNRGELRERRGGRPDPQTGQPELALRRPSLGGFRDDPHYLTVMALEVYDAETGTAEPAPILLRRVHGRAPAARPANVHEALLACGDPVDLERVAALAGLPGADAAAAALGDEVFRDPAAGGAWVRARDYFAGDVRHALTLAREAAAGDERYRRNVAALAAAVPPDLGPLEIGVALGAPWIPATDIEAFVRDVLGGQVRVWHLPSAASWKIVPTGRVPVTRYRTARLGPYQLLADALNRRSPVVFDTREVPGRRLRVRNVEDSLAAQEMLDSLQERFRSWVWEDEERTVRLCREYNRRLNSHVTRRVDGSRLTFPGLAEGVELWPWQRDVVAQIVSSPATLCAHAVGAGKTRAMVCAAVTARRLGAAAKPLIAVPAHLLEQTAREARQAYPAGRFLVATDESRAALAARCATGEWDAVIVTHGMLAGLPVDPATEAASLDERIAGLRRQIAAGKGGRHGRSVLTRQVATLAGRAATLRENPRPAVTFDDLGVDLLLVDEAHYFKRLPVVSRMAGVSLGSSQRAADLLLKARVLRARRGTRPSLALFTGTPWSNTVAETFVWQTFVQPDVLAAAELEHFDAWAAVFVEYETVVEVSPDSSGIRLAQRPCRVANAPELRRMLARSADVLRPDELGLERPPHTERTVVCEPTPGQVAYLGSLGARVDKIRRERVRGGAPRPGDDNMLAVCGDGRRAALDPRLVGVAEDSAKVAAVADEVARLHREHAGDTFEGSDVPGVLQVIFCDQGTPGADGPQTYGRLRRALAERGVPAERVRWVHVARTSAERAALFAACRDGGVSVLIGSTDKLGVGTNVQTRLRAVHHADAPWRPSDIEQREGRALRPGNRCDTVDVVRYVTRRTFDAYMWQTLQRKAAFVEQLYRPGDAGERTVDDISEIVLSFAEVKALATGNELLLEQAALQAAVARLRVLRSLDAQQVTAARRRLTEAEQARHRHVRQEQMLAAARLRLAPAGGGPDPVPAAVASLLARLREPDGDPAPVRAPWRGAGIELIPAGGWRAGGDLVELRITLDHRRVDELTVPLALLRRSDAAAVTAVRTRLSRWAERIDERIAEVGRAAVDAYDEAEECRALIDGHRFDRHDELAAAEAKLARVTTALEASAGGGRGDGGRPSAA